jgi:hypothetical protein
MLTNHVMVVVDVGALGVQSREEVKDLIMHHFGVRKHELYVYHSQPRISLSYFLRSVLEIWCLQQGG